MRVLSCVCLAALLLAGVARAQSPVVPSGNPQAQAAGQGMAAIEQAAAAGKYLFVFFWKEQNPQSDAMWKVLEATVAKMPDRAMIAAVQATDPAERAIVDRYGMSRAPMPMVLALAPCGAITKAFPGKVEEGQLLAAFVSPCTEKCMKALQDRKLVLLCVQNANANVDPAALQGVHEFKSDQNYTAATEVVYLNSAEPAETTFLHSLQINPQTASPVTVFMAPPGTIVGKFEGRVSKQQLVATLASAQSAGCPGGKCGPGGCGPKR